MQLLSYYLLIPNKCCLVAQTMGKGLEVMSDNPFYASALHYSIELLDDGKDKAQRHFEELIPVAYTNLCIDQIQAGVGGVTSWGEDAIALKPYRVNYGDRTFSFVLKPIK